MSELLQLVEAKNVLKQSVESGNKQILARSINFKVIITNNKKQIVVTKTGSVEPDFSPLTGSPKITAVVKSAIKEIEGLRIGDTITIKEIK